MKNLSYKSLSVLLVAMIATALVSCSPEKPQLPNEPIGCLPTVSPYEVFSFKEEEYIEHLWAVNEAYNGMINATDDDYLIWNDASAKLKYAYLSGEPMYLHLNDGLLICKNTVMNHAAVVLKEKEEGHDTDKWYYSKEDILDAQPFSSFYSIPGEAIGVGSVLTQSRTCIQDLVPRINALIDDGSIEQYRVDLGY